MDVCSLTDGRIDLSVVYLCARTKLKRPKNVKKPEGLKRKEEAIQDCRDRFGVVDPENVTLVSV